jgi:hypothetical protein
VDTVDTSFGSDRFGLVWGYRFAPGEPAVGIDCGGAEPTATVVAGVVALKRKEW